MPFTETRVTRVGFHTQSLYRPAPGIKQKSHRPRRTPTPCLRPSFLPLRRRDQLRGLLGHQQNALFESAVKDLDADKIAKYRDALEAHAP